MLDNTPPLSYTAGADLSGDEGRVVRMQAGGTVIRATDGTIAGGQQIVGIIPLGGGNTSGGRVAVQSRGMVQALAGAGFTRGTDTFATVDATGRLIPATAGTIVVARWVSTDRQASLAAGQLGDFEVLLTPFVTGLAVTQQRRVTLALGAEAAGPPDTIAATVNVVDAAGNNINAITNCVATLYDSNMIESLAAAAYVNETGAGAQITPANQSRVWFTTDANGDATLTVSLVAGGAATLYLEVEVLSGATWLGGKTISTVTFA